MADPVEHKLNKGQKLKYGAPPPLPTTASWSSLRAEENRRLYVGLPTFSPYGTHIRLLSGTVAERGFYGFYKYILRVAKATILTKARHFICICRLFVNASSNAMVITEQTYSLPVAKTWQRTETFCLNVVLLYYNILSPYLPTEALKNTCF